MIVVMVAEMFSNVVVHLVIFLYFISFRFMH
jgi:hypothetical protein